MLNKGQMETLDFGLGSRFYAKTGGKRTNRSIVFTHLVISGFCVFTWALFCLAAWLPLGRIETPLLVKGTSTIIGLLLLDRFLWMRSRFRTTNFCITDEAASSEFERMSLLVAILGFLFYKGPSGLSQLAPALVWAMFTLPLFNLFGPGWRKLSAVHNGGSHEIDWVPKAISFAPLLVSSSVWCHRKLRRFLQTSGKQ